MEAKNHKPDAPGTEAGVMDGTKDMGYWEFKKEICTNEGWQLRRIDPQVYEVFNSKGEKIGIFKSGQGYFQFPGVSDAATRSGESD
jgi:hypothetical protein